VFVYLAGPIVGALLAGLVYFKVLLPAFEDLKPAADEPAQTADAVVRRETAIKKGIKRP
jgi:hypothetical protein